jgi:hypothetical protein
MFKVTVVSPLGRRIKFGVMWKENWDKILYVLRHRKAFVKVQKELCGKVTLSGLLHDVDKLFTLPFLDRWSVAWLHQKFADHHVGNGRKITPKRLTLSIIDYECAKLTKPDKQLGAREFIYTQKKEYIHLFEPVLKKLGL